MDAADVIPRFVVDVLTSNAHLFLSLALSFAFVLYPCKSVNVTEMNDDVS